MYIYINTHDRIICAEAPMGHGNIGWSDRWNVTTCLKQRHSAKGSKLPLISCGRGWSRTPEQRAYIFIDTLQEINISHLGKLGKSSTQNGRLSGDMWSFPGGYPGGMSTSRKKNRHLLGRFFEATLMIGFFHDFWKWEIVDPICSIILKTSLKRIVE